MNKTTVASTAVLAIVTVVVACLWSDLNDEHQGVAIESRIPEYEGFIKTAAPLVEPARESDVDSAPFNVPQQLEMGLPPVGAKETAGRIKEQLLLQYPDLAKDLGLSQSDADRFLGLVAEQQASGMARTREQRESGAEPQDIQADISERLRREEREQTALLGSKYPQWPLYEGRIAARFEVSELRTLLGNGENALSEAQAASLEDAMAVQFAQLRKDLKDNALPRTTSAFPTAAEIGLRNTTERNRRLRAAASPHLTAPQLERFSERLDQQLRSQLASSEREERRRGIQKRL